MKFEPNPDEITKDLEEDVDAMACSAEFSQGCIDAEEQK